MANCSTLHFHRLGYLVVLSFSVLLQLCVTVKFYSFVHIPMMHKSQAFPSLEFKLCIALSNQVLCDKRTLVLL